MNCRWLCPCAQVALTNSGQRRLQFRSEAAGNFKEGGAAQLAWVSERSNSGVALMQRQRRVHDGDGDGDGAELAPQGRGARRRGTEQHGAAEGGLGRTPRYKEDREHWLDSVWANHFPKSLPRD